MDIKYRKSRDALTVFVDGELDEYSASHAKDILDRLLLDNINTSKVIFDLSGLSFMDSTGIGVLLGRYKKLKRIGARSYISRPSFAVNKILQISGLYEVMPKIN